MSWAQMNYAQNKPENIIVQVNNLDSVGKYSDAMTLLSRVLVSNKSKSHVRSWSAALEECMLKFCDLTIRLRVSTDLRTAFQTLKNAAMNPTAQPNNPQSFVKVVRYLLSNVKKTVNWAALQNEDDNQTNDETPETLAQLAFVDESNNDINLQTLGQTRGNKGRNFQALRFMFDVYRNILEVIKSSIRALQPQLHIEILTKIHEEIMVDVFHLCGEHNLVSDFTRFCLRARLSNGDRDHPNRSNNLQEFYEWRRTQQKTFFSTFPHSGSSTEQEKRLELLLKTKIIQLLTAIKLQHSAETSATFMEINELLSFFQTEDPELLLLCPAVYILQHFFIQHVSTKNALLHAHALHGLYSLFSNLHEAFPDRSAAINDAVIAQAKELAIPETSWLFAPRTVLFNGVVIAALAASSQPQSNFPVESKATLTAFGGLASNDGTQHIIAALDSQFSCIPANQLSPTAANDVFSSSSSSSLSSLFLPALGAQRSQNLYKTLLGDSFLFEDSHATNASAVDTGSTFTVQQAKFDSFLLPFSSTYDLSSSVLIQNIASIYVQFYPTIASDPLHRAVYDLFNHIVVSTYLSPLKFKQTLGPALDLILAETFLSQFHDALAVTLIRVLLISLSNCYTSLRIPKLLTLIPPAIALERAQVERIIVNLSNERQLFIKIDHNTDILAFSLSPQELKARLGFSLSGFAVGIKQVRKLLSPAAFEQKERRNMIETVVLPAANDDVEKIRLRYEALQAQRTAHEQEQEKQRLARELEQEKQRLAREQDQQRLLAEIERKRDEDEARQKQQAEDEEKRRRIQETVQQRVQDAERQNVQLSKSMQKQLAKLDSAVLEASSLRKLAVQVERQKQRELLALRLKQKRTLDYTVRALREVQREQLLKTKAADLAIIEEKRQALIAFNRQKKISEWERQHDRKVRFNRIRNYREEYRAQILADRKTAMEPEFEQWRQQCEDIEAQNVIIAQEIKAREEEERKKKEEAEALQKQKAEEDSWRLPSKKSAKRETLGSFAAPAASSNNAPIYGGGSGSSTGGGLRKKEGGFGLKSGDFGGLAGFGGLSTKSKTESTPVTASSSSSSFGGLSTKPKSDGLAGFAGLSTKSDAPKQSGLPASSSLAKKEVTFDSKKSDAKPADGKKGSSLFGSKRQSLGDFGL